MNTRLHLQPGQNGTKALVQKYGSRLVCVRYRYDADTGKRHKTVELIEETVAWNPRHSRENHLMQRAPEERVLLQIGYDEAELRERLRQSGGYWVPEEKAWSVCYGVAIRLELKERIIGDI